MTDELVEKLLLPGLTPGAVEVFLDFLSYSGGPLPEELLAKTTRPVSILWWVLGGTMLLASRLAPWMWSWIPSPTAGGPGAVVVFLDLISYCRGFMASKNHTLNQQSLVGGRSTTTVSEHVFISHMGKEDYEGTMGAMCERPSPLPRLSGQSQVQQQGGGSKPKASEYRISVYSMLTAAILVWF